MLPDDHPDRIHVAFDDHRLVANAGLILPATLGLPELVDRRLDLGRAPGRANTGDKVITLVASALAGGDCIDDAAMRALDDIRPVGAGGEVRVFGLSESQIARRVKAIARAAGLADWEFFSGHSGRVGMARRMAQNGAPTHEIERQGRWKQGGGMVGRYTRGESAGSALRYL